jgi:predicted transcriptional regulator
MSAKASQHSPIVRPPTDGHSGVARSRSARPAVADLITEAPPVALPTDPKVRAEILAGIERGMADVHAGRGVDLDDLLAEWDAKLASGA